MWLAQDGRQAGGKPFSLVGLKYENEAISDSITISDLPCPEMAVSISREMFQSGTVQVPTGLPFWLGPILKPSLAIKCNLTHNLMLFNTENIADRFPSPEVFPSCFP